MAGNIFPKYGSSASLTMTSLNSLAGSSGLTQGACSLAVNNTSGGISGAPYSDFLVGGTITWNSTTPASGASTYFLYVWAYGSINDTPTYPQNGSGSAIGTDAAVTFAALSDQQNATRLGAVVQLSATASKVYTFAPFSIASCFGGSVPDYWGIIIIHGVTTSGSTTSSSGNTISYTPIQAQYT